MSLRWEQGLEQPCNEGVEHLGRFRGHVETDLGLTSTAWIGLPRSFHLRQLGGGFAEAGFVPGPPPTIATLGTGGRSLPSDGPPSRWSGSRWPWGWPPRTCTAGSRTTPRTGVRCRRAPGGPPAVRWEPTRNPAGSEGSSP